MPQPPPRSVHHRRRLLMRSCYALTSIAIALGGARATPTVPEPVPFAAGHAPTEAAAVSEAPERSASPALHALQWMQTSAEYTALCLQTYNTARERVAARLLQPVSDPRPPAVILDLDETVIDNSPFMVHLTRRGERFTPALWRQWVRDGVEQAGLVPGAKGFIEALEGLGVTPVYITNRYETPADRSATIATLAHLGIGTAELADPADLRLLMKVRAAPSKRVRREAVRRKYRILALVGDNLGDFASEFNVRPDTTIASRNQAVLDHDSDWGAIWFVLPNPTYGAWQRLIPDDAPLSPLREWVPSDAAAPKTLH